MTDRGLRSLPPYYNSNDEFRELNVMLFGKRSNIFPTQLIWCRYLVGSSIMLRFKGLKVRAKKSGVLGSHATDGAFRVRLHHWLSHLATSTSFKWPLKDDSQILWLWFCRISISFCIGPINSFSSYSYDSENIANPEREREHENEDESAIIDSNRLAASLLFHMVTV